VTFKFSFAILILLVFKNLEMCCISRLLNYFKTIRCYICPIPSSFIIFEILQGRSRSRSS